MSTVLVIEDYEPLRILYHKFLTRAGYRVTEVSSCQEAFDYLRTETPDIILLDMTLSDGNGLAVVSFLSHLPRFKNTQFVAVTGSDRYQHLSEAYGIEYFLYKPVSMPMLVTLLERLTVQTQRAAS